MPASWIKGKSRFEEEQGRYLKKACDLPDISPTDCVCLGQITSLWTHFAHLKDGNNNNILHPTYLRGLLSGEKIWER